MNAVIKFPVELEVNIIDDLAQVVTQIKALEKRAEVLKEQIANKFGEGEHRGDQYGVSVKLCKTKTVDNKKLYADLNVSEETLAKYTKHGASIRVSVTA
jgi:cell division septum initiation protein DivIVA